MSGLGQTATFATPLRHVWKAAITRHSGPRGPECRQCGDGRTYTWPRQRVGNVPRAEVYNSDKTFIGWIEKGFDFLGYHFGPDGLSVAKKTV